MLTEEESPWGVDEDIPCTEVTRVNKTGGRRKPAEDQTNLCLAVWPAAMRLGQTTLPKQPHCGR